MTRQANSRPFPKSRRGQGGSLTVLAAWASRISLLAACLLLAGPLLAPRVTAANDATAVDICYDFTCGTRDTVILDRHALHSIDRIFEPPAGDAEEERERIRKAVARMEQVVGLLTPTFRDVGRNYTGEDDDLAGLPGQLDCVDESINTTAYLKLMDSRGLFRFHAAGERAYRQALLTQHWAASIVEHQSGSTWIVDSWFGDNGELPYVVRGEDWHDLSVFRRQSDRRGREVVLRDRAR